MLNLTGGGVTFHPEDDVATILLRREFLKILCGVTYFKEGLSVVAEYNNRPRTKAALQTHINEELDPNIARKDTDPAYYFDPEKWNVGRIKASKPEEIILRLSLFVEGMLEQEDGIKDAGVSYANAVKIGVQERKKQEEGRQPGDDGRGGHSRG